VSNPRSIAGGLGTPVKHGPTLPTNAVPFSIFILTSDPLRPQLYICNANGDWLACVAVTKL
jgi:hypothetical protein